MTTTLEACICPHCGSFCWKDELVISSTGKGRCPQCFCPDVWGDQQLIIYSKNPHD